MEPKDYISIASAAIALLALMIGIFHEYQRRKNQDRFRTEDRSDAFNFLIRDEVMKLFIASDTVGLRTVDALGSNDQKDSQRLELLRRTATQLQVVGHTELGSALDHLCEEWPNNPEQRESLKKEFMANVQKAMKRTAANKAPPTWSRTMNSTVPQLLIAVLSSVAAGLIVFFLTVDDVELREEIVRFEEASTTYLNSAESVFWCKSECGDLKDLKERYESMDVDRFRNSVRRLKDLEADFAGQLDRLSSTADELHDRIMSSGLKRI